jgi:hypothetical protein
MLKPLALRPLLIVLQAVTCSTETIRHVRHRLLCDERVDICRVRVGAGAAHGATFALYDARLAATPEVAPHSVVVNLKASSPIWCCSRLSISLSDPMLAFSQRILNHFADPDTAHAGRDQDSPASARCAPRWPPDAPRRATVIVDEG